MIFLIFLQIIRRHFQEFLQRRGGCEEIEVGWIRAFVKEFVAFYRFTKHNVAENILSRKEKTP